MSKYLQTHDLYCIGTWNVRSMNQGKLEVVKQETARVNVNILGISKLKWTGMGELNSAAAAAKSLQSCPTLCDPIDCSPPGSSVHAIFQARVLEWVAISSSRGDLPDPGIEPKSNWQPDSLPLSHLGSLNVIIMSK